ncbi:MAG: hypothetical protein IJD57_07385 [Candidatus Gastranaerophilales bacterium]|nr:hypothetical protein [Candidatus Gastranaerophilales bacterium]
MGFESVNPKELEIKILNSYKKQTKEEGKVNLTDYKYSVQHNAATNKTVFREQDNDTFLTELDDKGNYVTRQINEDELTEILLEDGNFEAEIAKTSYAAPVSAKQVEHKAGTGSTKERVEALSKLVKNSNINQFKNENGVSRSDIQKWLDNQGLSNNTSVDGGFNVDDVLQYYSSNSSGTYEIYYHLLANEAWIGKNADGNNKVDGKISQTEVKNFVKDRFGADVTKTQLVQGEEFNNWKKANIAAGNEFHEKFSLDDMRKFINYYYDYESPDNDNNNRYDDDYESNNRYDDDDYRYKSTLYSSDLDTTSEIKNLLNDLKSEGDFNATFTMNQNVNVYDNYGDKIKLANGQSYDILEVSSSYVTIDVDGEEIKVKRGTTSSTKGFEYLCQDAIKKAIINADTKFSSSATENDDDDDRYSDDDYRYNTTLVSSKLDTTSEIKNTLDNLKSSAEYNASVEMKDDVKVYDEYGDRITLSDGETYDIVNVEKNYITLDVDGEEVRVKRGTTSSSKGFEYLCQDAIEEARINADERITNTAKSTSFTYSSRIINSSSLDTKNEVKNVLNNLQDAGNYKANIYFDDDIKMYDEFTNKNVNFDSNEAYNIVKVTDDYVYLDVEGTNVKIERGTSSSQFETKCADMINKIVYSANKTISTTSSSSNSSSSINGTKYTNVSLVNYKPSQVANILDNVQDYDMDAFIEISKKYWFDEDSSPFVPVGEYEITKVTNSYVTIENEDGEEYRIPRGDDEEYTFEWYASKENKQGSTTKITTY